DSSLGEQEYKAHGRADGDAKAKLTLRSIMTNSTSRLITVLLVCVSALSSLGLIACYFNRGWLTIQNAANLAQIFASFAVGISLLFIATQIRLQTQLARGANSQSFVNVVP